MDFVSTRVEVSAGHGICVHAPTPRHPSVGTFLQILDERNNLADTKRGRRDIYLSTRDRKSAGQRVIDAEISPEESHRPSELFDRVRSAEVGL